MRQQSPTSWAIISVCIAAVVHFALGFAIEFSVDEAHYALYAQHLAWSYFDHPPLVGWLQWPLVVITSSEGVIRLIPELLWIISCLLVYQVTIAVHHYIQGRNAGYLTSALPSANTCGLMAVLTIIAAPIPHVLAIGLLPDTLLAPLSLGLMLMTLRWLSNDHFKLSDWLITGVLLGLAGLSKYTAAFTALAVLVVFLSAPRKPWISKLGFWIALIVALLMISPVLYWNWANDWISFKYQLAHGSGSAWLWRRLAAYVGIQILVYGPLLVLGAYLFVKHCIHGTKLSLLALLGFFVIPFAIFTSLAGGGGLPHWTTPAWFCLAPFAGIGLAKAWSTQHRRLIQVLLISQIVLCCLGFAYVLSGGISTAAVKSNPIADLYGWKAAGQKAAELAQAKKVTGIAVHNWTLGSRAAWYARPIPVFILDDRQDQFDLWSGQLPQGANVLLLNWSGMSFSSPIGKNVGFEHCEALDTLEIQRFGQILSKFDFSLCSNWQGPRRTD
ncbi:glycosyltransferase family 39 protein [Polynucleobacter sp. UK-Kesae-W10]|uniref:ArnT family glycosyltransferase n=1 Tax=Polynucleobacter sp. UK-Kesae-W10 TaxID=1819738 RepID=UPI001C0AE964|nr:glycosyltransferase family 39 protein [Polynucleobacter sp. UK-Kesae-W10]MBU3577172.1 glycosyltransferase family 39 protein [Polynucleobacter sp. UK-Kesae-W10]